ncbi:hypothetical protein ACWCOP_12225 [Maricaulaceae bacterium MS644]
MTQYHRVDSLGLSAVHVNRVLQTLHENETVTLQEGKMNLGDRPRLIALAEFDPAYLDQHSSLLA